MAALQARNYVRPPRPRKRPRIPPSLGRAQDKPAPTDGPAVASDWIRLSPTDEVWIDKQNKRVIVGGKICLRRGLLEMFACPQGTKEHESVVSVHAKAFLVHTALLAVGAQPGKPVQYDPKYVPVSGPRVQVEVTWKDEQGQVIHRAAKKMILHVKSRKEMSHDWVFAGSGFWVDEPSGERYYLAENGELICVSNFSSALLDLPIDSPRDNAQLLFEANTDQIPPLGTPVRLVLTPEIPPKEPTSPSAPANSGDKKNGK